MGKSACGCGNYYNMLSIAIRYRVAYFLGNVKGENFLLKPTPKYATINSNQKNRNFLRQLTQTTIYSRKDTTMLKTKKLATLLTLATAILTLAACGNDTNDHQDPNSPITLTIHAMDTYRHIIRAVESDMRVQFAEQGIEFNIELTAYDSEHVSQQNTILQVMLMAGEGYDIVFLNHHPPNFRPFADRGFLLDIYDLIDQDPNLTRDDFFTNVFSALEYRGGLYTFPFTFGFDFLGINANLPDSIVSEFTQKSSISRLDSLHILNTLRTEYPEVYGSFPHVSNRLDFFFPSAFIFSMVGEFIDFDNSVSHLNSAEFVNALNIVRDTPLEEQWGPSLLNLATVIPTRPAEITQAAEENIFLVVASGGNFLPLIPLYGLAEREFLNFIPLADGNGNTLLNTQSMFSHTLANVIFPAVGDGVVAWNFTLQLLQRLLTASREVGWSQDWLTFGRAELVIPILRSELAPHFERVLYEFEDMGRRATFVGLTGAQFGVNTPEEVAAANATALARLTELANRPVFFHDIVSGWDFLDFTLIDSFLHGFISAESLAQELHNRASLWLIGG